MDRFRQQRVDKTLQCGLAFFLSARPALHLAFPERFCTQMTSASSIRKRKEKLWRASGPSAPCLVNISCPRFPAAVHSDGFYCKLRARTGKCQIWRGVDPCEARTQTSFPFDAPCLGTTLQKARKRAKRTPLSNSGAQTRPTRTTKCVTPRSRGPISKTYARRQSGPFARQWPMRQGMKPENGKCHNVWYAVTGRVCFVWRLDQL